MPIEQREALFFTQGALITDITGSAFLPYQDTLKNLPIEITFHYTEANFCITQCKIKLDENALLKQGYQLSPVKPYLSTIEENVQLPIIKAYHRLQWEVQSRFCGQCGHGLITVSPSSAEKRCSQCQVSFFPRFSPAVIVVVQKEDKILLARSPHFPEGMYSALAGFIDLGETAEMAVHREVQEEVGIQITHLQYIGSQTWPFPDSFMIGFSATYLSGELNIDTKELESAQWFSLNALPKLPGKASIARTIIDKVQRNYEAQRTI